jgi:hypothetical protein
MFDPKVIQSIGNWVVKDVEKRYPAVEIRFFALKDNSGARIYIAERQNKAGLTGRLFELDRVPLTDPLVVKDVANFLNDQIERHVRNYLRLDALV